MAKVENFHKNIMGTLSFDGTFGGMRKPQDFIVYPINKEAKFLAVQSDTRFGQIDIFSGEVFMTKSSAAHANSLRLELEGRPQIDKLTAEQLSDVLNAVKATASERAGSYGVTCDNSKADLVAAKEYAERKMAELQSKNLGASHV